jgi:hypothetical protein
MSVKFSPEECELINNFIETNPEVTGSKESFLKYLEDAKDNSDDTSIISIAENAINKICLLDKNSFNSLIDDAPILPFSLY